MTDSQWVTVKEAGALLRPDGKPLTRQRVAQLLRAEKLKGKRLGPLWLVSVASIAKRLRETEGGPKVM